MNINVLLAFITTVVLSLILVPIVKYVGDKLDIIAHKNHRTIHDRRIVRIGGLAIYISFLIGVIVFLKTDRQINAILIGGFLIFMVGFLDDMFDLPANSKLIVEIIVSLIVIFYGDIGLKGFKIPFFPVISFKYISFIITMMWIIGITNAINLIDGLDGLCTGIAMITLFTISVISFQNARVDIAALSLILSGAILGCWFYNFYPASIFLGDCGALFLGFMIAVISLLGFGFKSSAFFTLGAPIVVLVVPIIDTFAAILRRKLKHKKFNEADREHLHHKLMFDLKLGHRNSVILLYVISILFSICSYIYLNDKQLGFIIFICLFIAFEVFVEYIELIGRQYRPVLTLVNFFVKSDRLPMTLNQRRKLQEQKQAEEVAEIIKADDDLKVERMTIMKKNETKRKRMITIGVIILICVVAFFGGFYLFGRDNNKKNEDPNNGVVDNDSYYQAKEETELMKEVYELLITSVEEGNEQDELTYAALYFTLDFYTWSNKNNRNEVGGVNYVIPDEKNSFGEYALSIFYTNFEEHFDTYGKAGLPEVESYEVISVEESEFVYEKSSNSDSYDVVIQLVYLSKPSGMPTSTLETDVVVTMIKIEDRFYVAGVNYSEVEIEE